jgi:hypothetical protein
MERFIKKAVQMLYLKWLNLTGFLLATLGAILLGISTDIIVDVDTQLLEFVASHSGTADYVGVPDNEFEHFQDKLRLGKRLSIWGYLFFILGFLAQLLDALKAAKRENNTYFKKPNRITKMDTDHPLYHFTEFNERIFAAYKEQGIFNLTQKEFDGKTTASFISDILRRKRNIHPLPYSDFKIHDELDFISKDLKYVTGVLYYLRPFIVNTKYTDGMYHQNLADRRFLMYANFGYKIIYNYWDRIGDLLHLYFETGLAIDNVYFGRVLSNMKDPYHIDPKHITNDPIYKQLKDLYENELKTFFDERHEAVHHFQLEAKHYWGNVELRKDKAASLKLNAEKHNYPEFMKKQLELFFVGFELALKLIDKLPDRILIFTKRTIAADGKYSIVTVKVFQGEDLTSAFVSTATYTEEDIVDIVAKIKGVHKKLVIVADEPQ